MPKYRNIKIYILLKALNGGKKTPVKRTTIRNVTKFPTFVWICGVTPRRWFPIRVSAVVFRIGSVSMGMWRLRTPYLASPSALCDVSLPGIIPTIA